MGECLVSKKSSSILRLHGAVVILAAFASAGCAKKLDSISSLISGGGSTPSAPTVSASAPLALNMYTKYDGADYVNNLKFAVRTTGSGTLWSGSGVATNQSECAVSAAQPNVECLTVVPEGRLYYSETHFQYSWYDSSCKLMYFQPYYYRASTATLFPPWADFASTNCSSAPLGAACFNGPAKEIVPNFPKNRSLVYIPDESVASGPQTAAVKVSSSFSQAPGVLSNRTVANDYLLSSDAATRAAAISSSSISFSTTGDEYVTGSYVDYYFSCRDDWYDPITYSIKLFITDQDTSASGSSEIQSWKEY